MPIHKYRSVEDMPDLFFRSGSPADNLKAAFELSAICHRLRPWRYPPGVHKFRSVDEAHRQRVAWERG